MKKMVFLVIALALSYHMFIMFAQVKSDMNIAEFLQKGPDSLGGIFFRLLGNFQIEIINPENITYNFTVAEYLTNTLFLVFNVSSNHEVLNWTYTLEDLRHNTTVTDNLQFSVNQSYNVVRWQNRLTVFARNNINQIVNDSVEFFVNVPNISPILNITNNEILVCEGQTLNYPFYAIDYDEDSLTFESRTTGNPFTVGFNDLSPNFSISFPSYVIADNFVSSGVLVKSDVGTYFDEIFVYDNNLITPLVDNRSAQITVIEINNPPSPSQDLGINTIYTVGDNSSFNLNYLVQDVEDGNQASNNLSFSLVFQNGYNLFNVSSAGTINYTSNGTDVGVYNITLCVSDLGIPLVRRHQNISICGGNNGSTETVCDLFQLVITDENRPPRIISYYPVNLAFSILGNQQLYFNISKHDPDGGVPDTYWYVDGGIREFDGNISNLDEFVFSFGCGVGGLHKIKAEITDGLLNSSVEWNISLTSVSCPLPSQGGGGGGGGGKSCTPLWDCYDWEICQNLNSGLSIGDIVGEEFRAISDLCSTKLWSEEICGYQRRDCADLNSCNKLVGLPLAVQECYYTLNPHCEDGIKNCHDGSCEVLIDCGGPCSSCPTCSDNKQNQGEEGVDCGGPCPRICFLETPSTSKRLLYISLVLLLSLLLILVLIKIYKIYVLEKKSEKEEEQKKVHDLNPIKFYFDKAVSFKN